MTPKYVLRTECIKAATTHWVPGYFIDIGAGTGQPTTFFLEKGYKGVCYDLGEENRRIIEENLAKFGKAVEVIDSIDILKSKSFDYLFSFEVLEHIEHDFETLKIWTSLLKQNGKILLSVPAHKRKYGVEDEMTGHFRRYDKEQLRELLSKAGYSEIKVYNYGFPLCYITRNIAKILLSGRRVKCMTFKERSIASGIARPGITNLLSGFCCRLLMPPFVKLQQYFFNDDFGDGYVVSAIKK